MMVYIWLGLLVAFIIIEMATAQLVTIWFAVGALASLITSIFTDNIIIQIVVFIVVSAIALIVTRPLAKKLTKTKMQPTNADMYIGSEGVVTESINNLEAKGQVKVRGSQWSARSFDDSVVIPEGKKVTVTKIEGVKLIVKAVE